VARRPEPSLRERPGQIARVAKNERDDVGLWFDYYYYRRRLILNLAFTGSVELHRRELREVWSGPLCLTRVDRPPYVGVTDPTS
jgi:hypothetical protein